MVSKVPGTLAFVYKDGLFPGENPDVGGADPLRIVEANDQQRAVEAGRQLSRFEAGMRADPQLAAAEQDAFGHSWGLANVTSAEVAGAEFDKVVSLSGAGMLPEWMPDPDTVYTDLSYRDILQTGQELRRGLGRQQPAFPPGVRTRGLLRGPERPGPRPGRQRQPRPPDGQRSEGLLLRADREPQPDRDGRSGEWHALDAMKELVRDEEVPVGFATHIVDSFRRVFRGTAGPLRKVIDRT